MAVYGTEKFNGDIINLLGKEFKVAAAEKTAVSKDSYMSSMYSGVYYVVVDSKATLAEIFNLNSSLGEDSVRLCSTMKLIIICMAAVRISLLWQRLWISILRKIV